MTGVPKPPLNPNHTLRDAPSSEPERQENGAEVEMQICRCVEVLGKGEDGRNIENCFCTNLPAQSDLGDIVAFLSNQAG